MKASVIIGLIGVVICLVLEIVGVATIHWVDVEISNIVGSSEVYYGLFRYCAKSCVSFVCTEKCDDIPSGLEVSYVDVTKGQSIASIVLWALCVGMVGLFLAKERSGTLKSTGYCWGIGCVCFVAGAFSITGCVLHRVGGYNRLINNTAILYGKWKLAYSFFLCLAAGILSIPMAIVLIVGTIKTIRASDNQGRVVTYHDNRAVIAGPA